MDDPAYRSTFSAAWSNGDPAANPPSAPPPPFVQPHLTRRQAEAVAKALTATCNDLVSTHVLCAALRNINRALEWRPDQPTRR